MTLTRPTRHATDLRQGIGCSVLVDAGPTSGLILLPRRRREALLAGLTRRRLDARLAAGEPTDRSRLLALRALQLVSRRCRERVAQRWDALAVQARQQERRSHTDVSEQIQQVADLLRSDQLVFAHGVAIALTLHGLAADAVRRLDTGGADLAAATARAAVAAMTPW